MYTSLLIPSGMYCVCPTSILLMQRHCSNLTIIIQMLWKYVDAVRARVGLKGLAECNPTKNLTSNKANLFEEIPVNVLVN